MLLKGTLQHAHFKQAINAAQVCATQAADGTLVFVSGPSGAGKSTLKDFLHKSLYRAIEPSKNQVPLIAVQAANVNGGYFSSKDFYVRMLEQLGDPFRQMGADAPDTSAQIREFLMQPFWTSIRVSMTEGKIRRAFEHLARACKLKAVLIDEGQSMCLTHAGRNPSDHLESLKCLAEQLGIIIFIFGTYDLLEIWNHSAQLNRRTQLIHLARYDGYVDEDRKAFFAVLRMYSRALAFKSPQILGQHAEEILEWTCGVFGEVDALFTKATIFARQESRTAIEWADIANAKYTAAQMERLRFEIEEGERKVRGEVRKVPGEVRKVSAKTRKPPAIASKHRRGHPGSRNPTRDQRGQQT
jgi:energy-coupling factor transporter ATP-binding protein EcfA2